MQLRRRLHQTFLFALLLSLMSMPLTAQQVGGYAGGSLRRSMLAREISMGNIYTPFVQDVSTLFSNSASLARLDHPSLCFSISALPFGQHSYLFGAGIGVGQFGGIGIGLTQYGVGDISGRDPVGRPLGTFDSRELSVLLGGGLAIGPGNLGLTLRYLRRDYSPIEKSSEGYAVDLSGSISFEQRIHFAFSLNSVAGELSDSSLHEQIPWDARLTAAYVLPFEERTERKRLDPTGIPMVERLPPSTYGLLALEARLSRNDSTPVIGVAVETVPVGQLADIGLGFRAGGNVLGDLSLGFFLNLPTDLTDQFRLDYAVRRDYELGDITHHITLVTAFD